MKLEMVQYLQINLGGIILLALMLAYIIQLKEYKYEEKKIFTKMLITNIIILGADSALFLFRENTNPFIFALTHLMCIIYFALHIYFGYLWLSYTLKKLFPEFNPSNKIKAVFKIPVFLGTLFICTSPWTGWIYSLGNSNVYQRGPFMFIIIAVSYLYSMIGMVITIKEMLAKKRIREQGLYSTLLVSVLPTIIGNIIQLCFYGLSIIWLCTAFSLLILFINMLNYQLSRDMLTGLFNRQQTNKQLKKEISNLPSANYFLFVAMIDIDRFKLINDEFGHLEGDKALKSATEILSKSCKEDDFLARFGGDEFIMLSHVDSLSEAEEIAQKVKYQEELFNQSSNNAYDISMSLGYEIFNFENMLNNDFSADYFISSADKKMYQVKKSKSSNERKGQ